MTRTHPSLLITLLLLLLAAPFARAATYYVATTGSDTNPGTQAQPFKMIQKGLNSAANGDTIQVASGTYVELLLWENKSLTLQGAGEGLSIIDGGGAGRCVTVNYVPATARFEGFTIQNNKTLPNTVGMDNNHSYLTVSHCTFNGNRGGMYNIQCSPTVTYCTFSNNSTTGGGGMYNFEASPTVTHCTFTGNSANYLGGGGMHNRANSNPIVTYCTFTGNSATGQDISGGGGIINGLDCYLTVSNCTFTNNSVSGMGIGGGGIRIDGYGSTSGARITDCVFIGNSAAGVNTGGGGIDIQYGFATVTRCTFKNNTCSIGAGMSSWDSLVTVSNCTFTNNSSDFCGGLDIGGGPGINATVTNCTLSANGGSALITRNNMTIAITNCILWAATAATIRSFGDSPTVTYSNVQGGYAGTGNINADPLFINAAGGNYRLQFTSPCLNTGSASTPNLPSTDMDGAPRILGSAPDMGAYEAWLPAYGLWYVDKALGDDTTGNGSPTAPFKTVTKAITTASNGHKIYIKQGSYGTDAGRITKGVRLINWGNSGLSRIGQP